MIDDFKETWSSRPNRANLFIWTHRDGYRMQAQTRQNPTPRRGCRNKVPSLTNKLFLIDTTEKKNWMYPKWSVIKYINNTPGQVSNLGVLGQHKQTDSLFWLWVCVYTCMCMHLLFGVVIFFSYWLFLFFFFFCVDFYFLFSF